jgi:hypothetical protein
MGNLFPKECTVLKDPRGHVWHACTHKNKKSKSGIFLMETHRCSACGLSASTYDGRLLYDDAWCDITCNEAAVILVMES